MMEWLTFLFTICLAIFLISYVVKTFRNYESTAHKVKAMISVFITLILGSGLGVLFFRVAELSK